MLKLKAYFIIKITTYHNNKKKIKKSGTQMFIKIKRKNIKANDKIASEVKLESSLYKKPAPL